MVKHDNIAAALVVIERQRKEEVSDLRVQLDRLRISAESAAWERDEAKQRLDKSTRGHRMELQASHRLYDCFDLKDCQSLGHIIAKRRKLLKRSCGGGWCVGDANLECINRAAQVEIAEVREEMEKVQRLLQKRTSEVQAKLDIQKQVCHNP